MRPRTPPVSARGPGVRHRPRNPRPGVAAARWSWTHHYTKEWDSGERVPEWWQIGDLRHTRARHARSLTADKPARGFWSVNSFSKLERTLRGIVDIPNR